MNNLPFDPERATTLVVGAAGIYFFFLLYGLFQEEISRSELKAPNFLQAIGK
jgi:hypothetical protein